MNYKEAKDRIKARLDCWALDDEDLEALKVLIPEITESEDEKIRKALIPVVDRLLGTIDFPFMEQQVLDWFEKQKEQKPEMIRWTGDNLKEVIDFTGKSPRFEEWFKSWDEYEEYVHSHNDILKLFCDNDSHYEVPKGAWIVRTPDGHNVASRSKFIQKPAEWSEEDEKMLLSAIEYVQTYPAHRQNVVTWLKSLPERFNLQPKQEWTDEDEKIVRFYEADYNNQIGHMSMEYVVNMRLEFKNWLVERLKSLRPPQYCENCKLKRSVEGWKPSEEQMKAILNAINYVPLGGDTGGYLKSLYNDLKKLI